MTQRWERRSQKREAARQRMQKHGRSIFQVLKAVEERATRPGKKRSPKKS